MNVKLKSNQLLGNLGKARRLVSRYSAKALMDKIGVKSVNLMSKIKVKLVAK